MRIAAILALFLLASIPAQELEGRVEKASINVDFTYRSKIEKLSEAKYKLTHSIRNNSTSYLSVQWDAAGIVCIGAYPLGPASVDSTITYVVRAPADVVSEIKYGVQLNYLAKAQMYIDPQPKSASVPIKSDLAFGETQETTYQRIGADGKVIHSIRVLSAVNRSRDVSDLTFEVEGGFSLALAIDTRQEEPPEGFNMGFSRGFALNELKFTNAATEPALVDWVDMNTSTKASRFFPLNNPGEKPMDFIGKIYGKDLTLRRVKIIAFRPGRAGFIGLTATIYLPKNVPVH